MAQWAGGRPAKREVTSLIPTQGTCLGSRSGWSQVRAHGRGKRSVLLSHRSFFPSLSPSLPLALKINEIFKINKPLWLQFLQIHINHCKFQFRLIINFIHTEYGLKGNNGKVIPIIKSILQFYQNYSDTGNNFQNYYFLKK